MKNSIKIFVPTEEIYKSVEPAVKKIIATGVKATIERYSFDELLSVAKNSSSDQYVNDLVCCIFASEDLDEVLVYGQAFDFQNCILISHNDSLEIYRKALTSGFLEYTTVKEFISGPDLVLNKFLELRRGSCVSVAVMSVGGGAGASSVAQLFAGTFSRDQTKRTAFLDMDQFYGRARVDFGLDGYQSVGQSLAGGAFKRNLSDYYRSIGNLDVFGGEFKVEFDALDELDGEVNLMNHLKTVYDYIFVDIPTRLAGIAPDILMSFDKMVICARCDLASIRNLNNLITWVRKDFSGPISIIFNFSDVSDLKRDELKKLFSDHSVHFLDTNLSMFSYQRRLSFDQQPQLPSDKEFTASVLGTQVKDDSDAQTPSLLNKLPFRFKKSSQ